MNSGTNVAKGTGTFATFFYGSPAIDEEPGQSGAADSRSALCLNALLPDRRALTVNHTH